MERYPNPNFTTRMHFSCLENSVKIEKNAKTRKIGNILKTAGNIAKSFKIFP